MAEPSYFADRKRSFSFSLSHFLAMVRLFFYEIPFISRKLCHLIFPVLYMCAANFLNRRRDPGTVAIFFFRMLRRFKFLVLVQVLFLKLVSYVNICLHLKFYIQASFSAGIGAFSVFGAVGFVTYSLTPRAFIFLTAALDNLP